MNLKYLHQTVVKDQNLPIVTDQIGLVNLLKNMYYETIHPILKIVIYGGW